MKIAVVVAKFNEKITSALLDGCQTRLTARGITLQAQDVVEVPGAVELPIVAQHFARAGYDAVICLGAVIRGETGHYDFVCQQVSAGCQRVTLDEGVPIIFGVLTTDTVAQAEARIGGAKGHKGRDAADAAIDMVRLMEKMRKRVNV